MFSETHHGDGWDMLGPVPIISGSKHPHFIPFSYILTQQGCQATCTSIRRMMKSVVNKGELPTATTINYHVFEHALAMFQ